MSTELIFWYLVLNSIIEGPSGAPTKKWAWGQKRTFQLSAFIVEHLDTDSKVCQKSHFLLRGVNIKGPSVHLLSERGASGPFSRNSHNLVI